MLVFVNWAQEGPLFRFEWADDGFDDELREHLTPGGPIRSCYDEVLVPLATERSEQLTVEELVRAILGRTPGGDPPPLAIDWLGLALYGALRFRQAMAHLANENTPATQAEIRAAYILTQRLDDLYNQLAAAWCAHLRQTGDRGAA